MKFYVKQNDTSPSMLATLQDANGTSVNITNATVNFYMGNINGNIVNSTATIVNAAAGQVRYDWVDSDTANSGMYQAEFEVIYVGGTKETFPNNDYILVVIKPDLQD
jgi:hypothetical protein